MAYIVNSSVDNPSELNYDALCASYDSDSLFNEDIENIDNIHFKLDYIIYLRLVNSAHDNYEDKSHFFDNDVDPEKMLMYNFFQINVILPIKLIREVAIANGHMIMEKGLVF